jgi:hypothetical protein
MVTLNVLQTVLARLVLGARYAHTVAGDIDRGSRIDE